MKTAPIVPAALIAMSLSGCVTADAAASPHRFTAALTGAAETPGPGDADGSGSASVEVDTAASRICYTLTVQGIAAAKAAHIHKAPAGAAGGPVVTLAPPVEGSSSGCVDNVAADLAADIVRDPAGYYVNVHNADHPAGALRGQLGR